MFFTGGRRTGRAMIDATANRFWHHVFRVLTLANIVKLFGENDK
jgi:hypothetical protein